MKKYIDTKEILSKPKQSLLEKWYGWALKNAVVASMFAVIVSWVNKAVAEESSAWDIAGSKVTEPFQSLRKMTFIVGGFVLLILLILSIFKKLRWRWFFILLSALVLIAILGGFVDYMM